MITQQHAQAEALTVPQAAARLGITVPTLVAWLAQRGGPKAAIGTRPAGGWEVRLSASALQRFVDDSYRPQPFRCRTRRPYALRPYKSIA